MATLSSMMGGVKSVQRGTYAGTNTIQTANVTISSVVAAKSFVLIDNDNSTRKATAALTGSPNSTTIALKDTSNLSGDYHWQVVEYN